MLDALTALTTRRPWWVLCVALALLIGAAVVGGGVTERLRAGQGTEDPTSESALAGELLEEHFPHSRPNLVLLVESDRGVDDRTVARQALGLAEGLAYEDSVSGVTSYWQTGADELKSTDGTRGLVIAHLSGDEATAGQTAQRLADDYGGDHGELSVRVSGTTAILNDVERTIDEDLLSSQAIALPVTLLILVLVFGSVVAAVLPLLVGVTAILGTNAVLWFVGGFTDVSVFAQSLNIALGLGLAIDYALLMVRRFRDELATGATPERAVAATLRTSGRTVVFSTLSIAVALAAMLLFPLYFLRSFAYAGVSVVVLAALASLLVLPAVLVLLGHRVDSLSVRRWTRRRPRAAGTLPGDGWRRLAATVMGRAPLFATTSLVLLVVVGLPFLRVEFGMADDRQLPAAAEPRQVMDTIRTEFDNAADGGIDVVVHGVAPDTAAADVADYAATLSTIDHVEQVRSPAGVHRDGRLTQERTPPDALRESGDLAHLQVIPEPGIADISPESQRMVHDIRAVDSPVDAAVSGQAASVVDAQRAIGDQLPLALLMIVATTLVLVFLLTGSLLLPFQAVVVNALSLTAMFGAVVWVFQDGNLSGPLGFTPTGFIDTALPVLMFCIAFGLSMDYGMFLLARIREEYVRGGDHRAAVALGLQRTGGIITAAALTLAVVLVAIGMSRVTNTMMLGWGVALAVVVDATVVRCLLVPAVLRMSGTTTWWAPTPLRRLHHRFEALLGAASDPAPPGAPPPTAPPTDAPGPGGARPEVGATSASAPSSTNAGDRGAVHASE